MKPTAIESASCYSDGEREWMERTQRWRARHLVHALRWATRRRVRADHVTVVALVLGLAFPFVFPLSPTIAFILLGLHVVLDGLDGPLARAQGRASPRGSFTDTICDQVVLLAVTVGWIQADLVSGVMATVHLFAYHTVVLFAMARSALGIPCTWLIRPRFILYAAGIAEWIWEPGLLEPLHALSTVLLLGLATRGFLRLRTRLGRLNPDHPGGS